jgi:uncharacterized membrane protein
MSDSPNQFFPGIRISHQDGHHRVDHASVSGRTKTVIALAFGAGLAAYPHFRPMPLPPVYGPMMALFLPITALAMALLLQSLWNRDLFRDRDEEADRVFDAIVFRAILFVVGLHALLLMALTGAFPPNGSAPRSALTVFGLAIVSIGNLLPRTRPNLEVGVRTRRTLGDRAAWMQTHRMLGHATVVFGLLLVVAGLLFSKHAIETIVGPSSLAMAALLIFEHVRHRLR